MNFKDVKMIANDIAHNKKGGKRKEQDRGGDKKEAERSRKKGK